MIVFADEWVEYLRQRYQPLRSYEKPHIYHVATHEVYQERRREIEQYFSELSADGQAKILPRLRSPELFTYTYHELVVGSILRKMGCQVEYEKQIDGLEPDWHIEYPFRCIVEVFTADASKTDKSESKQVGNLLSRLQEIPHGVVLQISEEQRTGPRYQQDNKRIVSQVKKWLADEPPMGAHIAIDGLVFKVLVRDAKYQSVQCIGPGSGGFVDTDSLRRVLRDKTNKYGTLAQNMGIPVVIAVTADFTTGLGLDNITDVLYGHESMEVNFRKDSGVIVGHRMMRRDDGLFRQKHNLSAVLWLYRDGFEKWHIKELENPSALVSSPFRPYIECDDPA